MDFSLSKATTQRTDIGKQDENTLSELQGAKFLGQQEVNRAISNESHDGSVER
jgi:hypothetical protein